MMIEWIHVRVAPEHRDRFLRVDQEVWNPGLARQAGFAGKEVWLDEEDDSELVLVIRWEDEEAWTSIPEETLTELEDRFHREFPEPYEVVEARAWRVLGGEGG